MDILIVSAWLPEQEWLRHQVMSSKISKSFTFCLTGIGSVKASTNVTKALLENKNKFDAVIFCGTAGYYCTKTFAIGDIACIHRVGEDDIGRLLNKSYVPNTEVLVCENKVFDFISERVCVSTPSITTDIASALGFSTKYDFENLEFYGVATAAQAQKIPWVGCFGLSNSIGPQSHKEWQNNHIQVSQKAQEFLWSKLQAAI